MSRGDALDHLNRWYQARCNGGWEHAYGIVIETLDNPGWRMRVDLTGTPLAGRPFAELREGVDDRLFPESDSWLHCAVSGEQFIAAGSPDMLLRMLEVFADWSSGGFSQT